MKHGSVFNAVALGHAVLGTLGGSVFASSLVMVPGTYELTVETVMPHLEENLRYATTRQRRCLGTQEADALFPMLRYESFTGCTLAGGQRAGEYIEYRLVCRNPEAATGAAHLALSSAGIRGALDIKMGAKNMTFSQRIHGRRLGACEVAK